VSSRDGSRGRSRAAAAVGSVGAMGSPVAIRRARPADLPGAAALLARTLGFSPADAVPAWLMRTTDECGGLTLVAVADGAVVGVSYAIVARDHLFSCGLAVAPEQRGRRLGLELKGAQRREAVALGYAEIRWTTDPVNGRALRVYLSGLGAQITGYRAGLHDGLRADPGHAQDDLEIVWRLVDAPQPERNGARLVELPWSAATSADRGRVRAEMSALLAQGYVGSAVRVDRAARRCHVSFARPPL
jgi:predicted GNAT superfamily acetyltransferase